MLQLTLDPNDELRAGARLQRLEVYNWGTFNHQVWTIAPGGSTALLTGANGSGKSTLVDALLTLLVPNTKRNYNQASGAERRRERDEKSYVRGAYGRLKDEGNSRGVVQYLRDKTHYSVLLAHFYNAQLQQDTTLAQLFYWRDDELRKFFMIAPRPLSIAADVQIISTPDELRKRLKANGVEVYDEFSRYSRDLIKRFRLRSAKALDLFNQTVSIKEIGGLNEFVRQHMLERLDAASQIAQLKATYQNLTSAHDAIVKAEAQLTLLEPLLSEAEQFQQLQERISDAERCQSAVPFYCAERKITLLDQAIRHEEAQIAPNEQQATALQQQLDQLRNEEIDLSVAIRNDAVGQQMQQIARERDHTNERLQHKQAQAEKYRRLLHALSFPDQLEHAAFHATATQARNAIGPIEQRLEKFIDERDQHKQAEGRLRGGIAELRQEIESLRQRKSRIPAEDLRIRAALTAALELADDELPFVGELLKVRTDAADWEGAIERLLGGYGRQLLVPEAHYQRVIGYVEATNLRGRLTYHRADLRRSTRRSRPTADDALFHKLEIKPGSAFHDWLVADLIEHWDVVCCTSTAQFQREQRALTINGQIKRGGSRHEKDDRYNLHDRTRYVLGWDNRDKIAALEAELAQQEAQLRATEAAISKIQHEQRTWQDRLQRLRELLSFDDFTALDWPSEAQRISELDEQARALAASSDRLAQLQTQLAATQQQISQTDSDLRRCNAILTTLNNTLHDYARQRTASATRLASAPADLLTATRARILADHKQRELTLENCDDQQLQMVHYYTNSANRIRGSAKTLESSILRRMAQFNAAYPSETSDMDNSIGAVGEYRRMYERIARDDLPTHRQRFKEWLDGKVVEAIIGFQSMLDKQIEEYRESITTLNESLGAIAYTSSTYIQLTTGNNQDSEIKEFRVALRACIPDVGQRTADANELSFQRIRALIERFDKEERWTNKVTDVRNWLDFAAEERYREDGMIKHYYSDSSGKSGGQKAKLAYTILASAIAYQYGLAQDDDQIRTFRFVVVDEAFSKSDETNARYAMELFRQMNLQLLVVTPLDKTHVVEPYIAACHFVSNSADENDSRVISMSIAEYHREKAAFAAHTETVQ
jgi:uncharacterized protein YPO0396